MRDNDEMMDFITFACKKKVDMHEHIDFVTDGIAGRAGFYFSLYFTDLINKALASKTSTEDHLELDITLTADEKTYTMNDSDALLSAVKSLAGKSFTADVTCDGYKSHLQLDGVELSPKKYEIGDLRWLHKTISNLKAFLLGTYHGRCTMLQAYLDEFCFRFNRRNTGDQLFLRLARAAAISCG